MLERTFQNNFQLVTKDHGCPEFCPNLYQNLNSKIKVCPQTYYFSYTTQENAKMKCERFELLDEAAQSSDITLGFDASISENLYFNSSCNKEPSEQPKA
jgi:hypothetical protein